MVKGYSWRKTARAAEGGGEGRRLACRGGICQSAAVSAMKKARAAGLGLLNAASEPVPARLQKQGLVSYADGC